MGTMTAQQIYDNFVQAAGTGMWQAAQDATNRMARDMPELAADIKRVQDAMRSGWHGAAADGAVAAADPVALEYLDLADGLSTAQDLVGRQCESFTTAAHAVQPVPPTPTNVNAVQMMLGGPSVRQQFADYLGAAEHNVAVYSVYHVASQYNTSNLPLNYGQIGTDNAAIAVTTPASTPSGSRAASTSFRSAPSIRSGSWSPAVAVPPVAAGQGLNTVGVSHGASGTPGAPARPGHSVAHTPGRTPATVVASSAPPPSTPPSTLPGTPGDPLAGAPTGTATSVPPATNTIPAAAPTVIARPGVTSGAVGAVDAERAGLPADSGTDMFGVAEPEPAGSWAGVGGGRGVPGLGDGSRGVPGVGSRSAVGTRAALTERVTEPTTAGSSGAGAEPEFMPMTGAGARRRDDEERRVRCLLPPDDDDLFGTTERAVLPVIGE